MERVIRYIGGTIEFNIKKPGIYSMGIDSSTGKSHLYHILKSLSDESVAVLTYDSDMSKVLDSLLKFQKSGKDVLYVDRFDLMLSKDIISVLKSMSEKYVILDYKDADYNSILDTKYISFVKRNGGFYLNG